MTDAPSISSSPTFSSLSPTESFAPSGSPSSFAPAVPSPRPTPFGPFEYRAQGDSHFGYKWRDLYSLGHQHAFRRQGWSWGDISSGPAPFCFRDKCYDITEACNAFDGDILHSSVCSFPENVKIAGPSCWRGACTANGQKACGDVDGITIGEPDGSGGPQWCIFRGENSMIGPLCYGGECFVDAARQDCSNVGGVLWNDSYCIVGGYFTPVGPICWSNYCIFSETKNKCKAFGGSLFAQRWCLLPGCDRTVIGPTCSAAPDELDDQCFEQETVDLCNELNGKQIGQRFCVIDGTDWTFVGPVVYHNTELIGSTKDFCRELRHNLADYFNFMEAYDIDGRFCLVKQRIPTTTPFCTDLGCNRTLGKQFCDRFNGKPIGDGFMCSLCDAFRQVVGPLMYNETFLEGNPKFCEGPYCAIPHREEHTGLNLRCPQSAPMVSRCGEFGGAYGILDDDDDDNGNVTDDDDDDDNDGNNTTTSGSLRSLRVNALVLSVVMLLMTQSIHILRL